MDEGWGGVGGGGEGERERERERRGKSEIDHFSFVFQTTGRFIKSWMNGCRWSKCWK